MAWPVRRGRSYDRRPSDTDDVDHRSAAPSSTLNAGKKSKPLRVLTVAIALCEEEDGTLVNKNGTQLNELGDPSLNVLQNDLPFKICFVLGCWGTV